MKKNIKRTAAAVLALSMMTFGFAGCGQNNSSTGSASDSEISVNASADAENSGVISPAPLGYTVSAEMPDGTYHVDLDVSTLAEQSDGTYRIHATIEDYDIYDQVDMNNMKVGDTIKVAEKDVKVESLERDDSNGIITINGGTEEGGYDFTPLEADNGNGYRTLTMDDYPVYYVVGETDLTISANVKLSDGFGLDSPSEAPVTVDHNGFAKHMQENYPEYWTCGSTSVVVENGQVTEINRVWVP